ncbi:MAG: class I SAM-dependent methyltransferase [Dehalococcoidia bacterium]|nr:class I SAM-dependent methyltransferase [Dehalococcoidia bacterium]
MDDKETEIARRRYDRSARTYDIREALVERAMFSRWRSLLWSKVEGNNILEVGVGTGKNFPYYPLNSQITAIDFSEKMLERARRKAAAKQIKVELVQMDVQNLRFQDGSFDCVVGSFVFCSVPDPVRGLGEIKRVCKPGGKVLLLEHILSENRIIGAFMDLINPLVVRMMGANINRKTVENVAFSSLELEHVTSLGAAGIFRLIEARKRTGQDHPARQEYARPGA